MNGSKMRSGAAAFAAALLPALCAVLVGLPALDGGFCRDDWLYIPLNPLVSGKAPAATIFRSSFHPDQELGLYRPLTTLSLKRDFEHAGESTRRYHAVNLWLAALAAFLLARFLLAWGLAPLWAGLGAAMFAVHPARSEAVLWISGRAELLMTVFALLALIAANGMRGPARWPVAALAAVASAFSKEQGFVLTLLVPLLPGLARRERVTAFVTLALALGAAYWWRLRVLGAVGPSPGLQVLAGLAPHDLAMAGLYHLGCYARLLFWPWPLITEYDEPATPFPWAGVAAGALVAILPVALVLAKRPRAAFSAWLFLAPLIPVLNVFYRTGEAFAERFLCLPVAGFAALAALAWSRLPARLGSIGASVLVGAVLLLGAGFVDRARDWTSQRELVTAQLRDAPGVGGSHHLVAADLMDEFGLGQPEPADVARAGEHLIRALELSPRRAAAAMSMGRTYLRKAVGAPEGEPARATDLQAAERFFRAAIAAAPEFLQAHGALGLTLACQGRHAEAEAEMREELRLHPREFRAAINLSRLLEDTNRPEEARHVRERALSVALDYAEDHPSDSAPLRVAAQFMHELGRPGEALDLMTRAFALSERPEAKAATAVDAAKLLVASGRGGESRALLSSTRRDLDGLPESPERALALATLDQALGDPGRARAILEAALPAARGLSRRKMEATLRALRQE